MATKTFKAGEVAYGGLIKVTIAGEKIRVQFLDWNTKKTIIEKSFSTKDSRSDILFFIEDNSTYYWGCHIVEWLDTKVNDKREFVMSYPLTW